MHRNATATLTAVLALALAACGDGSAPGSEPEPAEPTGRPLTAPTDRATSAAVPFPEAADGEDYDACFDGECQVLVTEGVELTFDDEFRMGTTTVEFGEDFVRLTSRDGGGYLMFELGEGSSGNFQNTLNVRVAALESDRAILEFSPGQFGG